MISADIMKLPSVTSPQLARESVEVDDLGRLLPETTGTAGLETSSRKSSWPSSRATINRPATSFMWLTYTEVVIL